MVHHFTTNQQSQSVKQSVDGVSWLVDRQNYCSSITCHPVDTKEKYVLFMKHLIKLPHNAVNQYSKKVAQVLIVTKRLQYFTLIKKETLKHLKRQTVMMFRLTKVLNFVYNDSINIFIVIPVNI